MIKMSSQETLPMVIPQPRLSKDREALRLPHNFTERDHDFAKAFA